MCRTTTTTTLPLLFSAPAGRKRSRVQLEQQAHHEEDEATIAVPSPIKKRRCFTAEKKSKSVHFADAEDTVIPTPAASTSSTSDTADDESTASTWFTLEEYGEFKFNIKRDVMYLSTLHKMGKLAEMDREEFSPHGLEKYFASAHETSTLRQLKQQRIMAVLGQQIIQKQSGLPYDEKPIAMMAIALSQPACLKAIARAERVQKTC